VLRALARRKAPPLTPEEREIVARPWLNTFPKITEWKSEQSEANKVRQGESSGPIFRHIRDMLVRCPKEPRGLYLTSTDGYFSLVTLWLGAKSLDVFDTCEHVPGHEPWHFDQVRIAAAVSNYGDRVRYQRANLLNIEGRWDFCICTEVLENYSDPSQCLEKIRSLVGGPLVIFSQSAKPNREDVFESPSASRPWGCSFAHDNLIKRVVDNGWTVINERIKEQTAPEGDDQYFSYLNCV